MEWKSRLTLRMYEAALYISPGPTKTSSSRPPAGPVVAGVDRRKTQLYKEDNGRQGKGKNEYVL